jgi:hypothetical protein
VTDRGERSLYLFRRGIERRIERHGQRESRVPPS